MTHTNFQTYTRKPIVIDATHAHKTHSVRYQDDGTVIFTHDELPSYGYAKQLEIPMNRQYPLIFSTFQDLGKALSQLANSPLVDGAKTLRKQFDEEMSRYEELVEKAYEADVWEPDYGTYVFDPVTQNLLLIAPEFWHRLGLVTNTSKLLTDPQGKLSWQETRKIFDGAVMGFIGASVGGNILEGAMREIRPKQVKLADPDWVEVTNLNRLERGSIAHIGSSRAERLDPKNPYELKRNNKAEVTAHSHHMVDPYASWFVYSEGIHHHTIEQFLLGNGSDEPKIDILVEECDDLRLKVELRELCRKHKIPVVMLSDFGHIVEVQFQDFRKPDQLIGYSVPDEELYKQLDAAMRSGKREDRFEFIRALCGPEFERDEFGAWVRGEGEQPTSSLPQSGATAMASGGIGGKFLAHFFLGHDVPTRCIYDLLRREVIVNR